jgi:hypothetical protein
VRRRRKHVRRGGGAIRQWRRVARAAAQMRAWHQGTLPPTRAAPLHTAAHISLARWRALMMRACCAVWLRRHHCFSAKRSLLLTVSALRTQAQLRTS